MVAIELDGAGGYGPGSVSRRVERDITAREWSGFLTVVEESGFWQSESAWPALGADGAQWILEISQPNRYHVIDRWGELSPGRYLVTLSGLNPEPIY